jgi:hypothetical protein
MNERDIVLGQQDELEQGHELCAIFEEKKI